MIPFFNKSWNISRFLRLCVCELKINNFTQKNIQLRIQWIKFIVSVMHHFLIFQLDSIESIFKLISTHKTRFTQIQYARGHVDQKDLPFSWAVQINEFTSVVFHFYFAAKEMLCIDRFEHELSIFHMNFQWIFLHFCGVLRRIDNTVMAFPWKRELVSVDSQHYQCKNGWKWFWQQSTKCFVC